MKSILLAFAFSISALLTNAQTGALPIDGTDCSNLFFKALLEEDAGSLKNLVSADFTVTDFQGQTINGNQFQEAFSQGIIVIESGMLSGTMTRTYGNVAVVTGRWNVSAKLANNRYQGEMSYMSVCVKSGGIWKVTAVQLTPVR
ncbi:nuclear transport factor 2 family protein [Dyadobacter flavalbus]|uniref:Nuclear transport factor 2 family protein n=1 Tax=Dyadobacter flavalbus TaxID=2579942 RepID=A0A5M8QXE8_9BACT|nr:nuclear transport factor 2 family protein [Dyadobacter flavalbus]KAA6440018.1 nuclear transport factor 2 family protein [Dyadobacter flavalbus]